MHIGGQTQTLILHIYNYTNMYIYVYVYNMRVCIHAYIHIHTYMYIYIMYTICIHMYIYIYVCMCVYIYIHYYTLYTHTHVYTHAQIQTCLSLGLELSGTPWGDLMRSRHRLQAQSSRMAMAAATRPRWLCCDRGKGRWLSAIDPMLPGVSLILVLQWIDTMNRYKTYRDFLKWGPKSKSLHHDFVLKLMVTTGDPHVCQSHITPIIFLVWIPSVSACVSCRATICWMKAAKFIIPTAFSFCSCVSAWHQQLLWATSKHTHTHTRKKKRGSCDCTYSWPDSYIATSFQPVMATQISPTAWSHCWTLTQALMPALQEILGHRLSGTLATCELQ